MTRLQVLRNLSDRTGPQSCAVVQSKASGMPDTQWAAAAAFRCTLAGVSCGQGSLDNNLPQAMHQPHECMPSSSSEFNAAQPVQSCHL